MQFKLLESLGDQESAEFPVFLKDMLLDPIDEKRRKERRFSGMRGSAASFNQVAHALDMRGMFHDVILRIEKTIFPHELFLDHKMLARKCQQVIKQASQVS